MKGIGISKKYEIYKLTKIFKGDTPNSIMNSLFTIDFFMKPLEGSEEDVNAAIYNEFKPKMKDLGNKLRPESIRDISNMFAHILEPKYSALFYYDILMELGANATVFDSHTAFLAQECVISLGE